MIGKGDEKGEENLITLNCENTQNLTSNLILMDHMEPPEVFVNCNSKLEAEPEEPESEADPFAFENPQSKSESINPKYCILPKEFFSNNNIPPPLVCKSWLSLVYRKLKDKEKKKEKDKGSDENESASDDSLPLSRLEVPSNEEEENNKVRKRPRRKSVKVLSNDTNKNPLSDHSDNEYLRESKTERKNQQKSKNSDILIINRKRGRPKKTERSEAIKEVEADQFPKDNDEDWWSEGRNDSDLDIPWQPTEEEKPDTINYQEHDYFKSENEDKKSVENSKKATNKKPSKKLICEVDGRSKLVFPCSDCDKSFSAASTLKYHMRIHNGNLIKCTECDKGFTTNYLLKCHMRIHNGDLFMCHKCGRGFTTAELLKVHSRGHTGDRPFTCHICGKAFPSASNLRQHKETHDLMKKYLCFQCGASFSQKRCLDGHMLSHGEKNHICTVCGKLWARKSDLTEHMRVHTGSKPYSCSMCPQKFTQASSLRRHQIVHMETKPIPCMTCGKMFKCEDYYKRHVKKHEKESEQTVNTAKN